MKLSKLIWTGTFACCVSSFDHTFVEERNHHLIGLPIDKQLQFTMEGIIRNILAHRDFGSDAVKFSNWEDSNGELYIVPHVYEDDFLQPAYGLGYKLITDSNEVLTCSNVENILNVLKIKEENILEMGFPQLFYNKSDGAGDGSFFFGVQTFVLVDKHKSLDISPFGELAMTANPNDQWIIEAGQDDGSAFAALDHFVFLSIEDTNGYEDAFDLSGIEMQEDQDVINEIKYETITIYTTTVITSTRNTDFTRSSTPISISHSTDEWDNGSSVFTVEEMLALTTAKQVERTKDEVTKQVSSLTGSNPSSPITLLPIPSMPVEVDISEPLITEIPLPLNASSLFLPSTHLNISTFITVPLSGVISSNSTIFPLPKSSTIPNNGLSGLEMQSWNSFLGIVCLLTTLIIFV